MVLRQFYRHGFSTCVEIEARGVPIGHHTRGLTKTAYAKSVEARVDRWLKVLPSDADQLWNALVAFDQAEREALFSHCVAMTVSAVHDPYTRHSKTIAHTDVLAARVGLDMAKAGWAVTADTYLGHVTKARILEAVREAKGDTADRIAGLKKTEMVVAAEELLTGTEWLPEPLRTPGRSGDAEHSVTAAETGEEGADEPLEHEAEPIDEGAFDEDVHGRMEGGGPSGPEPKGSEAPSTSVVAEAAE